MTAGRLRQRAGCAVHCQWARPQHWHLSSTLRPSCPGLLQPTDYIQQSAPTAVSQTTSHSASRAHRRIVPGFFAPQACCASRTLRSSRRTKPAYCTSRRRRTRHSGIGHQQACCARHTDAAHQQVRRSGRSDAAHTQARRSTDAAQQQAHRSRRAAVAAQTLRTRKRTAAEGIRGCAPAAAAQHVHLFPALRTAVSSLAHHQVHPAVPCLALSTTAGAHHSGCAALAA